MLPNRNAGFQKVSNRKRKRAALFPPAMPASKQRPETQQLRETLDIYNKWLAAKLDISKKLLTRIEKLGALFTSGFTMMQIGEWAGAITCWFLLGFVLLAKSLALKGSGRLAGVVGSVVLAVTLTMITGFRKPSAEPWTNLQKPWIHATSNVGDGESYIHIEKIVPAHGYQSLIAGSKVEVNIEMMKVGRAPLQWNHAFKIQIATPEEESDIQNQYRDLLKNTSSLPFGETSNMGDTPLFDTRASAPLSSEDLSMLLAGTKRIYTLAGLRWQKPDGSVMTIMDCYWFYLKGQPVITTYTVQHNCR